MAANLWTSTQASHWLLDRQTLDAARARDRLLHDDILRLGIFHATIAQRACKQLLVRQQVAATALVYWHRFFTKNSFFEVDPFLVLGTSLYLACKIEECPHHIKNVVNELRAMLGHAFPYDATAIAEFEFYLLEELEFSLVIFHPYRPLQQFFARLNLPNACLQTAWFIVNDTFRTRIPLLYPPYLIALAAISLAASVSDYDTAAPISASEIIVTSTSSASGSKSIANMITDLHDTPRSHLMNIKNNTSFTKQTSKDLSSAQLEIKNFFLSLNVDMHDIVAITQDIFDLYRVWETYHESRVMEILSKGIHDVSGQA